MVAAALIPAQGTRTWPVRRRGAEGGAIGGAQMGDAASRTGWGVVLAGHSFDLEYWREALKQRFDPA